MKRGRPRRIELSGPDSPFGLWQKGERLRAAYPSLPLGVIARYHLGVDPATYRRWRRVFAGGGALGEFLRALHRYDLNE